MSFPTAINRVFVIEFENAELSTVLNNGPFFKSLYDTYGKAANYFAACHPSAPNYLAETCGATLQCGSDSYNTYNVKNIADVVEAAGLTWIAYMQNMPSPCDKSSSGLYVVRHNPFVYYQDIVNNTTRCNSHVVPATSFDPTKIPPNFVWFTPNLDNDGHDTSVSFADTWFKGFFPTLLSQSWAATTAFFIVWDEGSTSAGFDGVSGGHIYFVAVSPLSKGKSITTNATHYNLLTTVEYLLGLSSTGHNDDPTKFPPMTGLFTGGTSPLTVSLTAKPSTITLGNSVIISAVVSGGTAPYTYAWTGLPTPCPGTNTPTISCIPSSTGTFSIQVKVTDSTSPTPTTATATTTLIVTSTPPTLAVTLTITPNPLIVNQPVTFNALATGGVSPYIFKWTGLPTPCTSNPSSTINCSPTQTGSFPVTVQVTDSETPIPATANDTKTLTINPVPPITPIIVVQTPCTAIVYTHGQPRVVRWVSTHGTGPNVKIELFKAGVFVQAIVTSTPNIAGSNAFSWTIPTAIPGTDYEVKVTDLSNPSISGISGGFTIN